MENVAQASQQYMVHDMKATIKQTCWYKMTYRFHRVIVGVPSHTSPHLDVVLEVHNNMISTFIPINLYGHMALIDMRMNNCIVQCIGYHYPSTPSPSLTHTIKKCCHKLQIVVAVDKSPCARSMCDLWQINSNWIIVCRWPQQPSCPWNMSWNSFGPIPPGHSRCCCQIEWLHHIGNYMGIKDEVLGHNCC